jgi:hypothetical protein
MFPDRAICSPAMTESEDYLPAHVQDYLDGFDLVRFNSAGHRPEAVTGTEQR